MRTDDLELGSNHAVSRHVQHLGARPRRRARDQHRRARCQRPARRARHDHDALNELTAAVTLDSADFVVNTLYANNQFLSNDFEAVGLQLAALTNGTWTVAFRDDCSQCNVLARRYDATGLPVRSELAAGDTQFPVTTTLTTSGAIPAVAASGDDDARALGLLRHRRHRPRRRVPRDQRSGARDRKPGHRLGRLGRRRHRGPGIGGNFVVTWQSSDDRSTWSVQRSSSPIARRSPRR